MDEGLSWRIRNACAISKQLTSTQRLIHVRADSPLADGMRLDRFLALALPTLSRSLIKRWLERGYGQVSGRSAKPSTRLATGAVIDLVAPLPPDPTLDDARNEPPPLAILYEDEGLIVVDKPPGQLAHQAGRVLTGTVLNQLQDLIAARGGDPLQARLVNRIDRDTSGILVASLDAASNRQLSIDLQAGRFDKTYEAICHGVPEPAHGHWRQPIRDDPSGRSIARQCHTDGQPSHTEYRVIDTAGTFARLRIDLHTGRQHQIRVHAAANGHPLFGDWTYGPACEELRGQALHAARLSLPHPRTRHTITIEAPFPDRLQACWEQLASGQEPTPRALDAEERRRLGLADTDAASDYEAGGWRRPSWLNHEEYLDFERLSGEEG